MSVPTKLRRLFDRYDESVRRQMLGDPTATILPFRIYQDLLAELERMQAVVNAARLFSDHVCACDVTPQVRCASCRLRDALAALDGDG